MNDFGSNCIAKHVGYPASNSFTLVVLRVLELLRVLDSRKVLLLLVQVVLVHLFLKLDVFFINSVDLLSKVLMLSLKSLNQLVLILDLLDFLVVHVGLDFHLVSERDEFLSLKYNLHIVILFCVTSWLALFSPEGTLTDLY